MPDGGPEEVTDAIREEDPCGSEAAMRVAPDGILARGRSLDDASVQEALERGCHGNPGPHMLHMNAAGLAHRPRIGSG